MPAGGRKSVLRIILLAVALAAVALVRELWPPIPGASPERTPPAAAARGQQAVLEAYRQRQSNLWVDVTGVVERVLPDDRSGSRHQRFILGLDDGHTLLVSHNIDVAERAPVARGDSVELRGEYEWNEQGGVIHWTHHDPEGRQPGGWIRTGGRTYR
jgi:hypothetical protein